MLASKCSVLLFPWHAWQRCICGIRHSTPKPREDTVLWLGFLSWLIALSEDHCSMWKCEIKWHGKHQVFNKGKVYVWWSLLKLMVINSCLEAYSSFPYYEKPRWTEGPGSHTHNIPFCPFVIHIYMVQEWTECQHSVIHLHFYFYFLCFFIFLKYSQNNCIPIIKYSC